MGEKEPRKLKDIDIEEISLVDEPAVPKAKFLIVKRATGEEDEMSEEKNVSEKLTEKADGKKTLEDAIKQIKDALKEEIPDKVKTLLEKVVASLESFAEGYGYGYPAPKKTETEKRGRRFSKDNEGRIRKIYDLAKELLDQVEEPEEPTGLAPAPEEDEIIGKCVELINDLAKDLRGGK